MIWHNGKREDGVQIVARTDAYDEEITFQILAPGRVPVNYCPCCGKLIRSPLHAEVLADRIYSRRLTAD